MAKLTAQEFIDAIKEMTVLELNDLVKACEEEFGVSAAAGVVVAAAGGDAAAAEEKTEFLFHWECLRLICTSNCGNASEVINKPTISFRFT